MNFLSGLLRPSKASTSASSYSKPSSSLEYATGGYSAQGDPPQPQQRDRTHTAETNRAQQGGPVETSSHNQPSKDLSGPPPSRRSCSNASGTDLEELAQNKMAETTVALPMYDLSGGLAQFVPSALLGGFKFEGVWHTGVRVFGKEVWFGGGIMQSEFDDCPFGAPVKVVTLGNTKRTHKELMEFIRDELLSRFTVKTYHVLQRNCNHFTNELVQFLLCGQQIPEEVLLQPQWAQIGPLAQILVPAMNAWLGGFGGGGALGSAPTTGVVHMSRAEKEREQKRLATQWAEWVQERQRERQVELDDFQKEAEDEEFTNFILQQHQKMEDEEKQAEENKRLRALEEERRRTEEERRRVEEEKQRKEAEKLQLQQSRDAEARCLWEKQNPERAERRKEAEQTLREVFDNAISADPALLQWALSEAREAGVEFTAPFLIRDAEYAVRERAQRLVRP